MTHALDGAATPTRATRRGECKTPGGKLAAVTIAGGACRLDGDFFTDGDDAASAALLADIERTLGAMTDAVDAATDAAADAVDAAMRRHPDARLVGTDARAIALAWQRALAGGDAPAALCAPAAAAEPPDDDWRAWWRDLRPVVVIDDVRDPDEQMALDERWAREVAAGERPATVRFWRWGAPAVVVGRFQSIRDEVHLDAAQAEGFAVVRRCTGGGAMIVRPDDVITYSLYAPASFVAGVDAAAAYRRCDGWAVDALRRMGVDARFGGLNDIVSPDGKIGGAAARRFPGAVGAILHHTTLAYRIDADGMARILNTSAEKMRDKAVRSARRRVDPLANRTTLDRDEIMRRLADAARMR
ncbi:lipoate--protein ligase family protein [Bifidobacterium samirii]|nr:lipoate--protein ligase family protein [Bifidobacterium samirii]